MLKPIDSEMSLLGYFAVSVSTARSDVEVYLLERALLVTVLKVFHL